MAITQDDMARLKITKRAIDALPVPGGGDAYHWDSSQELLAAIPSLPRAELSRLTERLIDRMDEMDADPHLEREMDVALAGDDGCGPVLRSGQILWGAAEEDEGRDHVPNYGEDQSAGPLWDRFSGYRWRHQEKAYE